MKATEPYVSLDERTRAIFRRLVENYMEHGDPVSSRTLSRYFDRSPATMRNIMADLEDLGLIEAPHTSAGRLPTLRGLRLFIDGIMETGTLTEDEQRVLESQYREQSSRSDMFVEASRILSSLSRSAGLVVAPKADKALRHIEFVQLSDPMQAVVVIVSEDGTVENRVMSLPAGLTPDILKRASNFLSERLSGKTLREMGSILDEDISIRRGELGALLERLEQDGIAFIAGDDTLVVRGTPNLLEQGSIEDIERVRQLMEQLEAKETASKLLEEASQADGVKIFLGAENPVFQSSGHSMILTPYRNGAGTFVGAVGVIGPTRLNYAKIIPSVNFMAEIISRNIRKSSQR